MATKFVYTSTEVEEITAKYQSGITLDVLALDYNKSVPSVRMKLVKLGVYQKAATVAKPKTVGVVGVKPDTWVFPTTKSGIKAHFEHCLATVGPAPF